jgi:cell division protein FtsQ
MGRKQAAQLDLELPDDEPVEQAPEPPAPRRARARAAAESRSGWRTKIRRVLIWTGAGVAVLGAAAGAYQIDEFLASDSHFVLPGSPDATANPNFTVDGAAYTPRADIVRAFARDFGRSVYLMPLAERRQRLLAIDWVKDATVSRIWPNRIAVRIVERKPVAFAMLPSMIAGRWAVSEAALIDAGGVILRPPAKAQFSLPALIGVSREDASETRRARVRQAVDLIREVQAYAGQISEIDVSDPENLTITEVAQGRPLRLRLGNRNYLSRLSNFLSHYPDVSRRLPNARTFDLRLDDHITAQDGGADGR